MEPDPRHHHSGVARAIESFGSQSALAAYLGVKQPTVSEWLRGDRTVPAERCPVIERGTRERHSEDPSRPLVLCEELRPDVAWGVLREQIAPPAEAKAA